MSNADIAIQKLQSFYDAACELSDNWDPSLNHGYAFDQDFQFILGNMATWMHVVKHGYPVKITFVRFRIENWNGSEPIALIYEDGQFSKAYATFKAEHVNGREMQPFGDMTIGFVSLETAENSLEYGTKFWPLTDQELIDAARQYAEGEAQGE